MKHKLLFFKAFLSVLFLGNFLISFAQDLVITTEVCGNTGGSDVRLTGPFWGWDPTAGPVATDNGNGTYTFTLSPAPTADMEYLLILDGVQENLVQDMVDGGNCAPITDYANYANRMWLTTDPLTLSNVYDQCLPCASASSLDLTIDVCGTNANEVRITGPFWGWDPTAGPVATDNGNGTWTVSLSPVPTADMEYLVIVDGVQENLIEDMVNGGSCAPVTDYFSYANRLWSTSDPLTVDINFDRCVPCSYPDLTITTEICDTAGVSEVKLVRSPNWDWNNGKLGVDNGDGTWTFTYSPAPADSIEYQIFVDQVGEDLVQEMIDGASCAPLTDYFSYANRLWTVVDGGVVNNTYNSCVACGFAGLIDLESSIEIYPNPTTENLKISGIGNDSDYVIYNTAGVIMLSGELTESIDVSILENGLYILELHNSTGLKINGTFIKQ